MKQQINKPIMPSLLKEGGPLAVGEFNKHRPATRIVSLILSLAMLLTLTAGLDLSAFATTHYGECNDDVNWKYEDSSGTLYINGKGEFSISDYEVFKDKITHVVINEGITEIGWHAFMHFENLMSVNIADSVKKIGMSAFESCYKLKNITFSKNLKEIGYCAFGACSSLTELYFPDGMNRLGQWSFYGCENLKYVRLPNSIEYIVDAFGGISEGDDYRKTSLSDVFYNGTEEQWNQIEYIASNTWFETAKIHFNTNGFYEFSDITEFNSYYDYIVYTSVNNSFLKGTNPPYNTVFEPARAIDRAMMVTILYRMAGEPYANGGNPYASSPFTDITNTSVYYYDAACWALKNGVTTETTFKPFNNVTREQTATFLYRYAQDNNKLGSSDYMKVDLSRYHDGNSISHFAVNAMKWANYNGMITGTEQGYANPQGATQRIHATKILYGFGKVCNIGNFA